MIPNTLLFCIALLLTGALLFLLIYYVSKSRAHKHTH